MAIIERKNQRKPPTYQVKVRDTSGNWYPTPTFLKREDAEEEEMRLLKLKRKGIAALSKDARTFTVMDYWEVWSIENRGNVSPGWRKTQDQMYRDYIESVIGKLKMRDVGVPEIGRVLNRADELGRSPQTRVNIYTLLKTMFRDAVDYYEMIPASPVKARFHRPKVKRVERKFLHPQQTVFLLQSIRDHDWLAEPVWLAALAGLRKEALQALHWPQVQWELHQILICQAYKAKEKVIRDYPKGKSAEYVPMTPPLEVFLRERLEQAKDRNGFVCHSPKGQHRMMVYDTFLKGLKDFCRKVGVPVVTPHELRHSCTEMFTQAGASAEDIRRLLNHKSLTATRTYIHRTDDRVQGIAQAVGQVFQNLFPKGNPTVDLNPTEERGIVH